MNALNFGRRQLRRTALAAALGMSLASGVAMAQSNASGSIFGQTGAATAGTTVLVENSGTGFAREVPVDSNGRYRLSSLPVGTYKVTLKRDGEVVSTQDNVGISIGGGREVSFGGAGGSNVQNLEGVSVIASSLPAIDVSSVDSRTVITAEQLAKVPVARNITAAALLAPGVVAGDSRYGVQALSFGGSAASENATYINGYAVTNPLTSIGFSELPFNSIDQEQVLTGGYGAEFGRATGGVINIITKRGSNEWKAGIAAYWEPEALQASPRNIYYPANGSSQAGRLFQYRNESTRWRMAETAYVSGPLIKDKLFFYLTGEAAKQEGVVNGTELIAPASRWQNQSIKTPRWLAKIDWNISDSHIVELTGISDKQTQDLTNYAFDYEDVQRGGTANSGTRIKNGGETYIGKYTGYITDDFTVTALYGKQDLKVYQVPVAGLGYDPNQPFVTDGRTGAPATGGVTVPYTMTCPPGATAPCRVSNPLNLVTLIQDPGAYNKSDGWRVDFQYVVGDHSLRAGYDVQNLESRSGQGFSGVGYRWTYRETANPNSRPGNNAAFVPIGAQEYVQQSYQQVGGTFRVEQEAEYFEDRWQISDRWLASLGLRNEQFKNFNAAGQVYV
ncbi:MAG TPA: TonB-dependent receptor, partial [Luteibacter sp.]|nr:TonB-dependent receptor [Luteibacter sp.]